MANTNKIVLIMITRTNSISTLSILIYIIPEFCKGQRNKLQPPVDPPVLYAAGPQRLWHFVPGKKVMFSIIYCFL